MTDALSVCNLGLGKIAASRISNLSPARTALERHCSAGYPTWRDQELSMRRWVFAMDRQQLTQNAAPLDDAPQGNIYQYGLPPNYLRALRDKHTTWVIRGTTLYSSCETQWLDFMSRVPEGNFDPLFVDVLAGRVAKECVEFATQSNSKGQTADSHYSTALDNAARANAFIIGSEDVQTADENDTWIAGRMGILC